MVTTPHHQRCSTVDGYPPLTSSPPSSRSSPDSSVLATPPQQTASPFSSASISKSINHSKRRPPLNLLKLRHEQAGAYLRLQCGNTISPHTYGSAHSPLERDNEWIKYLNFEHGESPGVPSSVSFRGELMASNIMTPATRPTIGADGSVLPKSSLHSLLNPRVQHNHSADQYLLTDSPREPLAPPTALASRRHIQTSPRAYVGQVLAPAPGLEANHDEQNGHLSNFRGVPAGLGLGGMSTSKASHDYRSMSPYPEETGTVYPDGHVTHSATYPRSVPVSYHDYRAAEFRYNPQQDYYTSIHERLAAPLGWEGVHGVQTTVAPVAAFPVWKKPLGPIELVSPMESTYSRHDASPLPSPAAIRRVDTYERYYPVPPGYISVPKSPSVDGDGDVDMELENSGSGSGSGYHTTPTWTPTSGMDTLATVASQTPHSPVFPQEAVAPPLAPSRKNDASSPKASPPPKSMHSNFMPDDEHQVFQVSAGMIVEGWCFTDSSEVQGDYDIRICHVCKTDRPGANTWRRSLDDKFILCNKCGIYQRTHHRHRATRPDDHRAEYSLAELRLRQPGQQKAEGAKAAAAVTAARGQRSLEIALEGTRKPLVKKCHKAKLEIKSRARVPKKHKQRKAAYVAPPRRRKGDDDAYHP